MSWRTLTHVVLLSGGVAFGVGCFAQHGRGEPRSDAGASRAPTDSGRPRDSGPGSDAGSNTCGPAPSEDVSLRCPPRVSFVATPEDRIPISVGITHGVSACCPRSAASEQLITGTPNDFVILPRWDLCECCLACGCLAEPVSRDIPLGELGPGEYTVRSEDITCEFRIDVLDKSPRCSLAETDRIVLPTVVEVGQPIPVGALGTSPRCGCEYRLTPLSETAVEALACECCDTCECVDGLYLRTTFVAAGAEREVRRVRLAEPLTKDVIVAEPGDFTAAGAESAVLAAGLILHTAHVDAGVWLEYSGTTLRCHETPVYLRPAGSGGPPNTFDFTLMVSSTECDGPPISRPFAGEHYLGRLEPGRYEIHIGTSFSTTLEVR